jgi:hypothetical protein
VSQDFFLECQTCGILITLMRNIPETSPVRINLSSCLEESCPQCGPDVRWTILIHLSDEIIIGVRESFVEELRAELFEKWQKAFRERKGGEK